MATGFASFQDRWGRVELFESKHMRSTSHQGIFVALMGKVLPIGAVILAANTRLNA